MSDKTRVPAVEGWFTLDPDAPHLLGNRCTTCGSSFFPRATGSCRNPGCDGTELLDSRLSRRGTVWSYTTNCYQPPAPYVSDEPFQPYTIAAVELADEKMIVLGQVATPFEDGALSVGAPAELVLDTLFEDDDHAYVVWKWRLS